MKDRIIITVESGMVVDVTGIPDQCIVEIRDYDVQPGDKVKKDEEGLKYQSQIYSGGN